MSLQYMFLRSVAQFSSKPPWIHRSYCCGNADLSISGEVISILAKVKPIEPALEPLLPFISPKIISSVIKEEQNRQLAFRFFIWASKRERLRSRESLNLVIDMLSEENGCDLYWQTLEELKNGGLPINSYSFLALISAYDKMGMAEKAMESFGRMKEFDCRPDVITCNFILQVMIRKEVILLALAVYKDMVKCNCPPDRFTYGILMDGLFKKGRAEDALKLLDEMTQKGISPDRVIYTIILQGFCQMNRADEALRLFHKMKGLGIPPDTLTRKALLDGLFKLGRTGEAFALLPEFEKDGFVLDLRGYRSLIDGLFRASRYTEAYELYKKMLTENIKPDIFFYTTLIQGLSKAGKVKGALKLFRDMPNGGVVPDTYCYNVVIKALCEVGLLDEARSLQLEMSENNVCPDVYTYTIMICSMCRHGLVSTAEEIFKEMEQKGCSPTVVTFNAMIDGLCKAGEIEKATHLFYRMEVRNHSPSLFLQLLDGGNRDLDLRSLTTMVDQYYQSGRILKAYKMLLLADPRNYPDIVTYNILVNAYCNNGNIDRAIKLTEELKLKGLRPDSVTYATLMNGLEKCGREEDAWVLSDQMEKNGRSPGPSMYRTLMMFSCRKRKLAMAFKLWLKYLRKATGSDNEEVNEIERCFGEGDVERAGKGLIQLDIRLKEKSLKPYSIWLIGLCQSGKVEQAVRVFSLYIEEKIVVTPAGCVKLIQSLCKRGGGLDTAVQVFVYTLENGFKLMPQVCDNFLRFLLQSKSKTEVAFEMMERMKLVGYDVEALLSSRTLRVMDSCRHNHYKANAG